MKAPIAIAVAGAIAGLGISSCANMFEPEPRPQAQVQPSQEVRTAQSRLQSLGFYTGRVDGLWGPETVSAVERFQVNNGLTVSGRLDQTTAVALRDATRPEPVRLVSADDVRTIQDRLNQLGFYSGPIDGVWGSDTQIAMERFQRSRNIEVGSLTRGTLVAMNFDPTAFSGTATTRSAGTATTRTSRDVGRDVGPTPLQPRVVSRVQDKLKDLGFYDGSVDGVWGPSTQAALRNFQQSRGLESTGDLTPATASVLGFDPNNLTASARK